MKILIREVSPQEFVGYFGEPSRDALARFVLAPVPFPRGLFFAYREGTSTPIARVGVSQSLDDGKSAAVGFWAGDPEAYPTLMTFIENWLRPRGVSKVMGPMIYTTWFPYRARLYSLERAGVSPDFDWEPKQPKGDEAIWEFAGYEQIESYSSRAYDGLKDFSVRLSPPLDAALKEGFQLVSFAEEMKEPAKRIELLNGLFDLTMESFSDAFLFNAISREHFHQLYVAGLSEIKDLSCSFLLRDSDGRAAAFSFAFPDQGYLVLKTIAVGRSYRGKRLSNAAMAASCQEAVGQGLDTMIHALMRRGNISEVFGEKSTLLWEHRYGLFAKSIASS